MTTQQFITKVSKWENYFNNGFQKDLLLRGVKQLAARIANRVQETGVTGEGRQHQYSTKTMLVGRKSFTKDAAFNKAMQMAKGKTVGKKNSLLRLQGANTGTHWVTVKRGGNIAGYSWNGYHLIVLQGGYKMVRQLEGFPTYAKIYSRTKEMWSGFGIKAEEKNKFILGGKTKASQDKINWNSERDKDNIIAANQTELNELTDYLNAGIKQFIHDSFSN